MDSTTVTSRTNESTCAAHVDDLFSMIENVCGTIRITPITNERNPFVCARKGHVEDLRRILEEASVDDALISDSGDNIGIGSHGKGRDSLSGSDTRTRIRGKTTRVHSIDMNKRDIISGSGRTILQEAAAHGHAECIDLILEYGRCSDSNITPWTTESAPGCFDLKVNAKSYLGHDTALHFAVQNNHRDIVFALLHHGADPNQPNKYGKRPLHYVTKKTIASLLLSFGASTSVKDNEHYTPLDICKSKCMMDDSRTCSSSAHVNSNKDETSALRRKEYVSLVKFLEDANAREIQGEIRDEIEDIRRQKKEIELLRQREEEAREKGRQKDRMEDYLAYRMR